MTPDSDASRPNGPTGVQGSAFQSIAVRLEDEVCIASLQDARLEDIQVVTKCKGELLQLISGGSPVKLVIDFGSVEYASPIMLSSLLILQKAIQTSGGSLRICGLNTAMTQILEVARLDRMLNAQQDIAAAVASF